MRPTMQGRITECVLLAYRTPIAAVAELMPKGLTLMTHQGWAFWNIVACRIESMRPAFCPEWVGRSYCHVGYRLYVHGRDGNGKPLEGLYFVRSDADNGAMCSLGNWMTDFRFHRADVQLSAGDGRVSLKVYGTANGAGEAMLEACVGEEELSRGSCFETYSEARRVLKYRPMGLSVGRSKHRIKIAEVTRDESHWRETSLRVIEARWGLFDELGQDAVYLEMATRVEPVDYRWRLGAFENCIGGGEG